MQKYAKYVGIKSTCKMCRNMHSPLDGLNLTRVPSLARQRPRRPWVGPVGGGAGRGAAWPASGDRDSDPGSWCMIVYTTIMIISRQPTRRSLPGRAGSGTGQAQAPGPGDHQ